MFQASNAQVYPGSSATVSLTKFPARSVTMFLSKFVRMYQASNVPLFPDSSVPMFLDCSVRAFQDRLPGRSVPMSQASNVPVSHVSSVPMFQGSNVSRFQCNSAALRKGFMEENKETLKSLGFTSHTTTCHQALVFQKRALSETHRALFLIVIYFHIIYH